MFAPVCLLMPLTGAAGLGMESAGRARAGTAGPRAGHFWFSAGHRGAYHKRQIVSRTSVLLQDTPLLIQSHIDPETTARQPGRRANRASCGASSRLWRDVRNG